MRLVPRFAAHAADLAPAQALNRKPRRRAQLQFATAAVLTAGDVLVRLQTNSTGRGPGLRGGSFRSSRGAMVTRRSRSSGVRWTEDLAVSGTIEAPAAAPRDRAGAPRRRGDPQALSGRRGGSTAVRALVAARMRA